MQVLESHGAKLVGDLGDALPDSTDASGELRHSIQFEINVNQTGFRFRLLLADYYEFADKGRKPGKQPPLMPIMRWITEKGRRYDFNAKGLNKTRGAGGVKKLTSVNRSQVKSLAYVIARAIGRRGTKGTNFYSSVVNQQALDKIVADIQAAYQGELIIEINSI